MNKWNLIYENFDRVAFNILGFNVYWYGLAYASGLIIALIAIKYFIIKDKYPITNKELESFFIYAEISIILGARIGYILIYDTNTMYFLTHPWEIFNPFVNGKFIGISGMSYHGAVIGFIIGSYLCAKRNKKSILLLMDSAAIAMPLGYILGRIGNFLNKELVGRETTLPIGILVNDKLVHPSQLYEAFLEGFCVFIILFFIRKKVKFQGEIIGYYMLLYSIARFIVEFFREADSQMGYFYGISTGQILSIITLIASIIFLIFIHKLSIKKAQI
ncbi:prolipoprotein diacylglyceryl transferase [Helicobacter sp. MIT 14-3879]|uniref:prolipoprotein diacylglyceryl transferase n=1 Tax=Helicobacter sp. MIT 14-3879 TaxID=2040649 RepID=UPI000E1F971B|nr:prolipoprotein diacylglyceryl transferase [Helicobacter sp. MIT 14-3879]RDU65179.1 prolipoprotein diacylglyceryl transferase [Helicobacter sp. MIT 14-3879]